MKKKILTIMLTVAVMLAFSVPVTAGSAEAKTAAGTAQTATAALQTAGTSARTTTTVPKLRITFVDVGAGDCTYIELPGGADILIDAGLSGKGESVVSKLDSLEPGMDLEYVISTHPDADHCGGLQSVFEEMHVKHFYYPSDAAYTTTTAKNVMSLAESENDCKVTAVSGPMTIYSKDNGNIKVQFIQGSEDFDTDNADSLMTYIKYNKFDALIAGDVEGDAQLAGKKINTDVLLVPHHGSNYTSSSAFISRYDPEAIVISTDGHKYGHPSQQAINRYFAYDPNIKLYRTDIRGSITCTSTGTKYWFNKKTVSQYAGNTSTSSGSTSTGSTGSTGGSTGSGSTVTNSQIVYITATGTHYHLTKTCRGLANATKIYTTTKAKAIAQGLTLCGFEDRR